MFYVLSVEHLEFMRLLQGGEKEGGQQEGGGLHYCPNSGQFMHQAVRHDSMTVALGPKIFLFEISPILNFCFGENL